MFPIFTCAAGSPAFAFCSTSVSRPNAAVKPQTTTMTLARNIFFIFSSLEALFIPSSGGAPLPNLMVFKLLLECQKSRTSIGGINVQSHGFETTYDPQHFGRNSRRRQQGSSSAVVGHHRDRVRANQRQVSGEAASLTLIFCSRDITSTVEEDRAGQ